MIFDFDLPERSPLRRALAGDYRVDETAIVERLLDYVAFPPDRSRRIAETAQSLVRAVRARPKEGGVEAFMQEYELSSHEGIVLMCLAEALLRVPDADTIDRLIEDKITSADWARHLGHSDSLFVNASTWGFMLTGSLLAAKESGEKDLMTAMTGMLARAGEPVIRQATAQAMRILGRQFIMGETIEDGMRRARAFESEGYRFSYDMLGEAARTNEDAEKFYRAYEHAIAVLKKNGKGNAIDGPGLSVKLSALDPRYEYRQYERTMATILPRLKSLALQAKDADIGFTVDAEEADRLELSFDIIEALALDPDLSGWNGFGLALQAYQKRALAAVDWLADLARRGDRRLMLRLVKGAYWDTEIKISQENGFDGYPVFTRKESTDLSYIACAKKILENRDAIYPQFATHNAHTAATILELAGNDRDFEFQRLHGMGEPLYDQIIDPAQWNVACRVYAPCGGHRELLPYLVRRLLENGANTSFVNRIMDEDVPIEAITGDPIAKVENLRVKPHPNIPQPGGIYGAARVNSQGFDLSDEAALKTLAEDMAAHVDGDWQAGPMIGGDARTGAGQAVFDPADNRRQVGTVTEATREDVAEALDVAEAAAAAWRRQPVDERAQCLERTADLMEAHFAELMAVACREAGKTPDDGIAEIREAVDFCRYYAMRARRDFANPQSVPGGLLRWQGRGVFVCISPWNFPLAIFTGQIAAALVAGNSVIAKPAEQTPLMAAFAVRLFHEAGIPGEVLQLLPGRGEVVGARLVDDPRVGGVAFTGGTDTAWAIRRALLRPDGVPVPFIAETGGQNAMIVDSTALPEQAIGDVLRSAFGSAGQRCSALRILFLQKDVAPGMIDMLAGAMSELRVGDPAYLRTDIGPVIDKAALDVLTDHRAKMAEKGRLIAESPLDPDTEHGMFFAPTAVEIESIDVLEREVFGPFLHVVRFDGNRLDRVIDSINATGYGLTFGVHSRIDATADYLHERVKCGNTYVNRNMIGAIVGVQPFGGEGLSGTGPKAGGPNYLRRFADAALDAPETPDKGSPPKGPPGNWTTMPIVGGRAVSGPMIVTHPKGRTDTIDGSLVVAREEVVAEAVSLAMGAVRRWGDIGADARAHMLEDWARDLESDPRDLPALIASQVGLGPRAGADAVEAMAAILRDHAGQGRESMSEPIPLRGYTGERDELSLHPRGVFLALVGDDGHPADLAGLLALPLAAGNPVLVYADGASGHLVAHMVRRAHEAGVPADALQFLTGAAFEDAEDLAAVPAIAGIACLATREQIALADRWLSDREGAILPLVYAVTGAVVDPVFRNPGELYRFVAERSLSVDTTASGGNASLFSMDED